MPDQRTPAERIRSAQIRAWARDNGWPDLSDRGKIPAAAREAYDAQHPGDDDDLIGTEPFDDDPELSAMDDSDLDDDGGDLAAPPASLDEARERAGRDPEPAHLIRGRKTGSSKPKGDAPVKVTRAVRDDITGKLAFWLSIPAEPWLRIDPYCGQAYADSVDEIAVKMSPLICQSPDLVRWFSKSTTFILWTELGIAVRPVAEAVIAHHVTKRIMLDRNGKVIKDKEGRPVPQSGGVDFGDYASRKPDGIAA